MARKGKTEARAGPVPAAAAVDDSEARRVADIERRARAVQEQAERLTRGIDGLEREPPPAPPPPPPRPDERDRALIEELLDAERQARIDAEIEGARRQREAEDRERELEGQRVEAEQLAIEREQALVRLRRRRLARVAMYFAALVLLVAWILRPAPLPGRFRETGVSYDAKRKLFVVSLRPDPHGLSAPRRVRLFYQPHGNARDVRVLSYERDEHDLLISLVVPPGHAALADDYVCTITDTDRTK